MTRRLVLVTGSPRSGTTPVGNLLALARGARSLYEPLNAHVGDRRVSRYFEVPGTGGFDEVVHELLHDISRPRLRLRRGLFPGDRGWRRAVKHLTGSRTKMTYRLCRVDPTLRTIVWKDPFAAFLVAPVVASGIPVVVTVRPPHAVAASFVRLGWSFRVEELVTRLLEVGDDHRQLLDGVDLDLPAHNAAVLWHIVYQRLLDHAVSDPGVHLLDVEHLVVDPVVTARDLYRAVGLSWDARVERAVLRRFEPKGGPVRPPTERAHVGHRDLRQVNTYWEDVLTPADVEVVERLDADLWEQIRRVEAD